MEPENGRHTHTHTHTHGEYCNPRTHARRALIMVILHWTMLVGKFIHDNLFFHTHLSQYSQSWFTIKFCQLRCMSVCSGKAYNSQVCTLQFTLPPAYYVMHLVWLLVHLARIKIVLSLIVFDTPSLHLSVFTHWCCIQGTT